MPRLACLALAGLTCLAAAPPDLPPPWLGDLAQAKALARKTGKPIFVVFRCEH
jgi:hypothetical protein